MILTVVLAAAGLCPPAAARREVLALKPLRPLVATVENGGGIDTLLCADFTGDGRTDMAFTVFSGGTAGDAAWVLLRRTADGWAVAFADLRTYEVGIRRDGSDLIETVRVYRTNDPNCCPSGGFDHRRFRWTGRALAVVRSWNTRRATG